MRINVISVKPESPTEKMTKRLNDVISVRFEEFLLDHRFVVLDDTSLEELNDLKNSIRYYVRDALAEFSREYKNV